MKKRCLAAALTVLMVVLSLPIGSAGEVHAADLLPAPANFAATQWGYALYLNWDAVEGAADYVIEESTRGKGQSEIRDSSMLEDSYEGEWNFIPERDRNTNVDCQVITDISKNKTGGGPYTNTYNVYAVNEDGQRISEMATISSTYETGISFSGRVQVTAADAFYTGEPVTTSFTTTDLGSVPVTSDDYTVEYENNTAVGSNTAKATLTGKKGTRFYDSKTVTFSILEQSEMTYDAGQGGFLLEDAADLQNFANIAAGVSKRGQGYTTKKPNGEAYDGEINIKAILQNDVALNNTVKFTGNSDAVPGVIDLDGHTITSNANYAFDVSGVKLSVISGAEEKGIFRKTGGDAYVVDEYAGAQVSFQNVILDAGTSGYSGSSLVWLHGGDLVLDNCQVKNSYGEGVFSDDGSSITVKNGSKIDTYHASFYLFSGDLTISDSEVKSANNRAVFSSVNDNKSENTITIDHSQLSGYYKYDDTAITASSSVEAALYLYSRTSLVVKNQSEIEGFNTGICTYGSVDIRDSWINAKRGILTKDAEQGTPTQKYPEYSVGLLYTGDTSRDVSISNTHIQANTVMLGHVRGFAIMSCPDGVRGDLLKLNKPNAIPAKDFLAEGQVFYAKNVADTDTYVNGEVYINDGTAPEDTTLHGYVEYVLNGATNAASNKDEYELNENDGYLEIANPTYKGAEFEGWYYDEEFSDPVVVGGYRSSERAMEGGKNTSIKASATQPSARIGTNYAEYTTLYAKWKMTDYTITYNLNGGKNNTKNPAKYNVNSTTITLAEPTRTGYAFAGWYKDSAFKTKVTSIPKGSTGNVTLYAKWSPVTYKITYNLNGGKNSTKNPANYNVTTATITLAAPTRTGYTFAGWYKDSKFKTKVTSIAQGSVGNVTLCAKWTANKYTVKFNANGGKGSMKAQKFTYNKAAKLTKNKFKNSKKTFKGWATSKANAKKGKVKYKNAASVKNLTTKKNGTVTLYAVWK